MSYAGRPATPATDALRTARDFVLANSSDYDALRSGFTWPEPAEFNFGLEWFDVIAGEHPDQPAVKIVEADLSEHTTSYGELARRSDQVANWLTSLGMRRGDKMIVMLHNTIELWEILLALTKVGAVAIPTSTLLGDADLAWRIDTAGAQFTIAPHDLLDKFGQVPEQVTKIGVTAHSASDELPAGWVHYDDSAAAEVGFQAPGPTPADDTCLLYFTSGTTSRPKLVEHTHISYPVGHLSTLYCWACAQGMCT